MLLRLLALVLCAQITLAATHPFGGPLPSSYRKGVADQLMFPDPQKRVHAVVRFRADGPDAASEYTAALLRAETSAVGSLRRLLQLVKPTDPLIETLKREVANYQVAANAARALVQTDHHKDKKRFAEMDRAFTEAEKAHKRLERLLKPGGNSQAVQMLDALQWNAEIRREQEFAAGKSPDLTLLPMTAVLETEGAPETIKALVKDLEPFLALREFHRAVSSAHAQMKAARPEQVQYAELLNERRVILNLRPYLLAEKLSLAATGHSEEMAKLKYFAHESPTPANRSFVDRIRRAGFEGNAGGECIYMGGSTPASAHTGWWYSDGHRLILYATGQTAQGIGRHASHWTFLTGAFGTFPL